MSTEKKDKNKTQFAFQFSFVFVFNQHVRFTLEFTYGN